MKSLILTTILLGCSGLALANAPGSHPSVLGNGNALHVCRSAPVQALRFIEVGEASLWQQRCQTGEKALQPPLLLEFSYRRNVPGSAFSRSALAMIERNVPKTIFADLKQRIEAFNSVYRDIGDGDRYQLRYLPDGRLELLLNDELLATEYGEDFAIAYLSIWFGPRPYSDRLKQTLLASE
jgi:hypothetical protein